MAKKIKYFDLSTNNLYNSKKLPNCIAKCINNSGYEDYLTIGKSYVAYLPREKYYLLISDDTLINRTCNPELFQIINDTYRLEDFVDFISKINKLY